MKKSYVIFGIAIIFLFAFFSLSKLSNKGDDKVEFKVLESSEIPEKIKEILPKYLAEEKAITCKVRDEIYVIVTRGEKRTGGYSVEIESIIKEEKEDGEFSITVVAKYNDPSDDDVVTMGFDYPFTIVKTNLNTMPKSVSLQVKNQQ